MYFRFCLGEDASFLHRVHHRLVLREQCECAVAEEVGTTVTNLGHGQHAVTNMHRGKSRGHVWMLSSTTAVPADCLMRLLYCQPELLRQRGIVLNHGK